MAYTSESLKAVVAGHGKAPAVFTYNTDDTLANITTQGYFPYGVFSPNDIIYARYSDQAGYSKIICVRSESGYGAGDLVDFSVESTFAGDVRATDDAGYQADNFSTGLGSGQGVYMTYTYRNNTDDLATIAGADYFADIGNMLVAGDVIEVVANDGHQMLMVTASGINTATTRVITFV
jgi:hypothetical protein